MSLITLWNFHATTEAYLVKSKLESEGITCFFTNEHMVGLKLHPHAYKDGMQLRINSNDRERATVLLRHMGYDVTTKGLQNICPKCGSASTGKFQTLTRGIKLLASAFRSFFALLNPFASPKDYCCTNCKTRF